MNQFVFSIFDDDNHITRYYCIEGESKEHIEEILAKAYDQAEIEKSYYVIIGNESFSKSQFEIEQKEFISYAPPRVYSLQEWFEENKIII